MRFGTRLPPGWVYAVRPPAGYRWEWVTPPQVRESAAAPDTPEQSHRGAFHLLPQVREAAAPDILPCSASPRRATVRPFYHRRTIGPCVQLSRRAYAGLALQLTQGGG
jgi:hypothetical protein